MALVGRCPRIASYTSSSSASAASRRNGEPNAGLGGRRGGETPRPLDELEAELELTLPQELVTLMRPLWRRDTRFLPCFSNDSLISTWIVATIGRGNVGGDTIGAGAGTRDDDDVERDFLRRMTGVGL